MKYKYYMYVSSINRFGGSDDGCEYIYVDYEDIPFGARVKHGSSHFTKQVIAGLFGLDVGLEKEKELWE